MKVRYKVSWLFASCCYRKGAVSVNVQTVDQLLQIRHVTIISSLPESGTLYSVLGFWTANACFDAGV